MSCIEGWGSMGEPTPWGDGGGDGGGGILTVAEMNRGSVFEV